MAQQTQLRRGTTAEHVSFTGALGEVTVDTTRDALVVHDGATAGGFAQASMADLASYAERVTSLPALKALSGVSDGQVAMISEGSQVGLYYFDASDLSAEVTNDSNAAIFVPPNSDATGASGAWVLNWGAVANDVTIAIGSGQTYTTIGAALDLLAGLYPVGGAVCTINLETGFTLSEQVRVDDLDFGWVKITATDATTTIAGSSMSTDTVLVDGSSVGYAFCADGGTLPEIACLFSVDGTGTGTRHGMIVTNGGKAAVAASCGVTNAPNNNLVLDNGAAVFARSADFSSAGAYGAFLYGASTLSAPSINLSSAGNDGITVTRASTAHIDGGNVSGAGENGVLCTQASFCNAGGVNANNCTGAGFRARGASTISANSATATGCQDGIYADRGCTISIDDDTTAVDLTGCSRYGILSRNGAVVTGGNVSSVRIYAELGGKINIPGATISNATASAAAVFIRTDGEVSIQGGSVTATGSGGKAVDANGSVNLYGAGCSFETSSGPCFDIGDGATIDIPNGTITTASTDDAIVSVGADVNAYAAIFSMADGQVCLATASDCNLAGATITHSGSAPSPSIRVLQGAVVKAHGTTVPINVTANTVTASGIVFR